MPPSPRSSSSSGSPAAFLTRKVGPLPVWGWAAGLIVAYLVFRYYKGVGQANAAPVTSTSPTNTDTLGGTGGAVAGGSGMGTPADNLSADLLSALGQQGFGTKDSYNTYAPVYTYTFSPTTTTDYGSGNTFPPSGGTAPGVGGPPPGSTITPPPAGVAPLPQPPPFTIVPPDTNGSASLYPGFGTGGYLPPGSPLAGRSTVVSPGGVLVGHGPVIE